MVFKKGHLSHNKGRTKENYEPLMRASEKLKNRQFSELHRKNLSLARKGKPNPKGSEILKRLYKEGKLVPPMKIIFKKEDREKIVNLYINGILGPLEIGKILGCSHNPIERVLKEENVKIRSISETKKRLFKEGKQKPSSTCFKKGNISWSKGLTKETDERLRLAGINGSKTIKRLLRENKRILSGCAKLSKEGDFSKGENNPNFNNWASREPYGEVFNPELKEQIRKRDSYRCQECFRHQDELRSKNNKPYKLHIHHIDFNKQNNLPNNLISLCRNCHSQTIFNRQNWTNYFQDKVIL